MCSFQANKTTVKMYLDLFPHSMPNKWNKWQFHRCGDKLDLFFAINQKLVTSCQQLQPDTEHNSTFHEVHVSLYASESRYYDSGLEVDVGFPCRGWKWRGLLESSAGALWQMDCLTSAAFREQDPVLTPRLPAATLTRSSWFLDTQTHTHFL